MTNNENRDNVWTQQTAHDDALAVPEYKSVIELEGVSPLDAQFGIWPTKNVPDVLMEPLFGCITPNEAEITLYGSIDAVPPMKTFAILDTAKIASGLTAVETCEMPYQCLFKGKTAQELKDVAPYVIELDAARSFTRRLFTYDPAIPENMDTFHLWHREPCIYIRSRDNLDEVCKHFRRFTRLQNAETSVWQYFRFYAPETLRTVIANLKKGPFEDFVGPCHILYGQSVKGGMIRIARLDAADGHRKIH